MRWGGARTAILACLLAPGCSVFSGRAARPEPPEPAVRIWLPDLVRWTGARREVSLDLENGTDRSVRMEVPAARRARVTLFLGPGPDPACGVEPDASTIPGPPVTLAPGETAPVTVDLASACGRLPPGEYRYEVGYEAPAVAKGPALKTRLRHGHVVLEPGAEGLDRGSLGSGGSGCATRSR